MRATLSNTMAGSMACLALLMLAQIHQSEAMQAHLWSRKDMNPDGPKKGGLPVDEKRDILKGHETCAILTNHESHSTVQIAVGTPAQKFDVVADTGSNNVIIPSCICENSGKCHNDGVCFTGEGKSSTFKVNKSGDSLPQVVLSFGSGDIVNVVSTDVVVIGQKKAEMKNGLLLMVDNNLEFSIEGILGLGPPIKVNASEEAENPADREFLKYAGIGKFSMCFNEGADGVLRLDTQHGNNVLGSIGQEHWGVGFEGISVGDAKLPALFCHKEDMTADQTTPCGGIPDSGTTMITGPADALGALFSSICDDWKRCSKTAAESPDTPKYAVLQQLLMTCEDWLDESSGLGELPDLYFHVTGAEGNKKSLALAPSNYVMQVDPSELQSFTRRVGLSDKTKASFLTFTGDQKKVCLPAFSEMDYNTVQNGPVFIFGTPFFYKYEVAYDLESKPPSISFKDGPCGSCNADTSFVSAEGKVTSGSTHRYRNARPRALHGPERMPTLDTSRPL